MFKQTLLFNYFVAKYGISLTDEDIEEITVIMSDTIEEVTPEKEIFDFYNQHRNKMPAAEKLTETRKSAIRKRLKENGTEKVKQVILAASKSGFMNGQNYQDWKASFDWIMKPSNFIKILEGNYNNKTQNGEQRTQHTGKQSGNKTDGATEIINNNIRYFEST